MAPPTSVLFKAAAVLDSFFLLFCRHKLLCTLNTNSLLGRSHEGRKLKEQKRVGKQASQGSFSRKQRYLTNPTPRGSPVTLSFSKFFWTIWPYEENSSSNWSNVYDLQRSESDKLILVSLTMGELNDKQTKTYTHIHGCTKMDPYTNAHILSLACSCPVHLYVFMLNLMKNEKAETDRKKVHAQYLYIFLQAILLL